jgi:UDP-glucose 4-epimerase
MIEQLKHNTYLCTGAAGFIGSHLTEEIVKQGKRVIAVDNLVNGKIENLPKSDLCEFWPIDVRNVNKLRDAMQGVDIVFHNAASKCTVCRVNPYLDLDVNAKGSFNVFQAAIEAGVKKVVHASTGSVNEGKPVSFYGVSKQAGESYLRAFKEYYPEFRYSCIRYHHVFGSRQDDSDNGGVIPIFIRNILQGKPIKIFGDGLQERHFTFVSDLVDVNFQLANESKWDGCFLNFANPEAVTIERMVDAVANLLYADPDINPFLIRTYYPARQGDIKKFNSAMFYRNYDYTPLSEGLKETIQWYKEKYTTTELEGVAI